MLGKGRLRCGVVTQRSLKAREQQPRGVTHRVELHHPLRLPHPHIGSILLQAHRRRRRQSPSHTEPQPISLIDHPLSLTNLGEQITAIEVDELDRPVPDLGHLAGAGGAHQGGDRCFGQLHVHRHPGKFEPVGIAVSSQSCGINPTVLQEPSDAGDRDLQPVGAGVQPRPRPQTLDEPLPVHICTVVHR